MNREQYAALAKEASGFVDQGEYARAIEIFEQLAASDLPDFDRAISWVNIATVEDKRGRTEDALACLARALDFERRTDSYFIAQHRAAYLSKLKRHRESLSAYRALMERPDLKSEDAAVFRSNIATLETLIDGHQD